MSEPTPPIPETLKIDVALTEAIQAGNREDAVRLAMEFASYYDKMFLAADSYASKLVGLKFKYLKFAEAMQLNPAYFEHVKQEVSK